MKLLPSPPVKKKSFVTVGAAVGYSRVPQQKNIIYEDIFAMLISFETKLIILIQVLFFHFFEVETTAYVVVRSCTISVF